MLSDIKELKNYLSRYCITHSEMLEAAANHLQMKCLKTSLIYSEAESAFERAERALKARVPEHTTLKELLQEYYSMIKEAYDDTPDDG